MKSFWRVKDRDGKVIASGETGERYYDEKRGVYVTPLEKVPNMLNGHTLEIEPPADRCTEAEE